MQTPKLQEEGALLAGGCFHSSLRFEKGVL